MTRRGIVNTMVALIAILTTGGLAAVAVIDGPPTADESALVAAGVNGRDSVAVDSHEAPAATRPTASTQPRAQAPSRPATTVAPRPVVTTGETIPLPSLPDTTSPPLTLPPVTAPSLPLPRVDRTIPPPPPPAPVVVQTGPASWKFEDKGITVTASVSPAAPQVGDTVTVTFTTGGAGENCCRAVAFVGSGVDTKVIGYTLRSADDPCQPAPVTSGTGSMVVTEPGPFTFDVQATRDPEGCRGPFIFTNVSLSATVQVTPAPPAD
jgi:hypothetical protein